MEDSKIDSQGSGLEHLQGNVGRPLTIPSGDLSFTGKAIVSKEGGQGITEGFMSLGEEGGGATQPVVAEGISGLPTEWAGKHTR